MPWEFGQCMSALVPAVKLSVCLSRNFSISLLAPQNVWSVEQISPYLNPTAIHGCQDRPRSEEHTSELQSLRHLVSRLLLEKKKKTQTKCIMRYLHTSTVARW